MIISHNILAMNAEISLKKNTNQKAKSSEKLSSGYRINRSSDDAAGLAISEKMRSQIRGLKRASNNVQDGISYIRVADGALNEVSNMLQRMRELAVQSANGVYSDDDRQKIQTEVDQIKNEIDRVFTTTEFNTKKIWDPDNVIGEPVLIGHHTESVVNFHNNTVITNITNSNKTAIPKTNFDLNANTSGITVSWDAYNGNHYTSSTVPWPSTGITSSNNFNLKDYLDTSAHPELEGIDANFSYSVNSQAEDDDVISALNSASFPYSVSSTEKIELYGADGAVLNNGIFSSVEIDYTSELSLGKDFNASDTSFIVGSANNISAPTNDSEKWSFSFNIIKDGVNTVATATSKQVRWKSSDMSPASKNVWWSSQDIIDSHGNHYTNISQKEYQLSDGNLSDLKYTMENTSGVNLLNDTHGAGGMVQIDFDISISGNNVGNITLYTNVSSDSDMNDILDRFAEIKGADIYSNASQNTDGSNNYTKSSSYAYNNYGNFGRITIDDYDSSGHIDLVIQSGPNHDNQTTLTYNYLSLNNIGISNLSLWTADSSRNSIKTIDDAIGKISSERAVLGAYENRLEFTYNNNNSAAENMQAAEASLRDTDIAEEMMNFAKYSILEQAGTSMLSHANQLPQSALSLLQ